MSRKQDKEKAKKYRRNNRERIRKYMKDYYADVKKDPEKRARQLRVKKCNRYGLTSNELDLLLSQTHCSLCSLPLGNDRCIDHDHSSGLVRGVLHRECNVGLGKLGEDVARLLKAAEYVASGGLRLGRGVNK